MLYYDRIDPTAGCVLTAIISKSHDSVGIRMRVYDICLIIL